MEKLLWRSYYGEVTKEKLLWGSYYGDVTMEKLQWHGVCKEVIHTSPLIKVAGGGTL